MNTNYLLILSLTLGALALILSALSLYLLVKAERLRRNFYSGNKSVGVEQILSSQALKLKTLQEEQASLLQELQRLSFNSNFALQKINVVRFNTFGDSGGNLSFSLALLDSSNSGFVITSMFGREQNRMYAKPIKKSESEFTLTGEEQKAIEGAILEWKNKIAPLKPNKNKRSKA